MSGRETAIRGRGSLRVAEPQELLVAAAHRGAFGPDGGAVRDTQRLWGLGRGECPDPHPDRLPDPEIVEQRGDEAVWGGFYTFHYGHFLTESVARLWPLLPGASLEGLPVVFATPARQRFIVDWESAFGLDVVELPQSGAVRFSRLLVPEPAWRMGGWIAPEMRDIHLHARRRLEVPALPRGGVLWLSRAGLEPRRRVRDEVLCQWLLGEQIRVVRPEALSLTDQIAELEACRAAVGTIGSAFHTLLLAQEMPACLYLAPSMVSSSFVAQDRLLGSASRYVQALANDQMRGAAQDRHPYRLLVPETLRALDAMLLTGLLDDPRLARMAYPERRWSSPAERRPGNADLDTRVLRVLLDPNRIDCRMDLGSAFEQEGLLECAVEQFGAVSDLAGDHAYSSLRAARALTRLGRRAEAAVFAERVLALEPDSDEARDYLGAVG